MSGPAVITDPGLTVQIAVTGLLFDMDGVLVRSIDGDERCWRRWTARHNLTDTFDLRRTHGRRASDTIREHLPALDDQAISAHLFELDMFAEQEQENVTAYPGARELLAMLPPSRWTVVTSASEKMMRSRLAAAGITAPQQAIGGDAVRVGKPHPEGYLRGAAILSQPAHRCLVIEDAPAGIRAGKLAGCQVLAVASSHRADELQDADWIISSLEHIQISVDRSATLTLRFTALPGM